jgi:hypothetical protein
LEEVEEVESDKALALATLKAAVEEQVALFMDGFQ